MDFLGLVKEARGGDQEAFAALLSACEHVITFHANRLSPSEPEDLAQHLRMTVCDVGVGKFDGRAGWITWVSRICATRGADYVRAQRPAGGRLDDVAEPAAGAPADIDADDRALLRRAMRRLSRREREAVRAWSWGEKGLDREALRRGRRKIRIA